MCCHSWDRKESDTTKGLTSTEFFLPGYLLVQINSLKDLFELLPLAGFFQCSFGKKKKKKLKKKHKILYLLLLLHDNSYCNHVVISDEGSAFKAECFLINLCNQRDR